MAAGMNIKVTRWKVGTRPLYQLWTEFVGRVMRPGQDPDDVRRWFNTWVAENIGFPFR